MFTLTIYFIVLNVYVEFVLIYRPHPVYALFENYKKSCNKFTQKRKPNTVLRKEALSKNARNSHSLLSFLFLSVFLSVGNMEISAITHSRFSHKI